MSVETALYGKLSATTAVTDLVGLRIYPVQVPQEAALPAVAYRRISTIAVHAHDGAVNVYRVRMQVTVHAVTYAAMRGVLDAVRGAIDGVQDVVSGIHVALLDSERDDVFGDATDLYIGQQDYLVTVED